MASVHSVSIGKGVDNSSAITASDAGGLLDFSSGEGGTNADTSGTGGAGGAIQLLAGSGGDGGVTSGTSGAGGSITLVAGDSGNVASSKGVGGDVSISAGSSADASSGGQVRLEGKRNSTDSVLILSNVGSSEQIKMRSQQGTGNASIHLSSDAGGVTLDAAPGKNVVIDGLLWPNADGPATHAVTTDGVGNLGFSAVAPLAHTHVKADITDLGAASTTVQGLVELATQAETDAGSDALKAVTPATLSSYSRVIRQGHTWAIAGEVKIPSGDTNFLIPFWVSLASGQTAKVVSCRYRINSGTSATLKIQKNGSAFITGLVAATGAQTTTISNVDLANNDKLSLVVTGVDGTPTNLSFTLFIDHTI